MAKENGDRVLYTGAIPGIKGTFTRILGVTVRVIDQQHLDVLVLPPMNGTVNVIPNVSNDTSQANFWEERVNGP